MVRTYGKSAPLGARIGDSAYPRQVGAARNGVLATAPAATGRLGFTRRFVFSFAAGGYCDITRCTSVRRATPVGPLASHALASSFHAVPAMSR
jgi:hypothetical protein